jgi:hypothetical protein
MVPHGPLQNREAVVSASVEGADRAGARTVYRGGPCLVFRQFFIYLTQSTIHNLFLLHRVSEFDLYFTFLYHRHYERIRMRVVTYIHARGVKYCTKMDQDAFREETDIVYMGCHDHHGNNPDICASSVNGCSCSRSLVTVDSDRCNGPGLPDCKYNFECKLLPRGGLIDSL